VRGPAGLGADPRTDVVLSYPRGAEELARTVFRYFRTAGLRTFFDQESLENVRGWLHPHHQAILRAKAHLILIADDASPGWERATLDHAVRVSAISPGLETIILRQTGAGHGFADDLGLQQLDLPAERGPRDETLRSAVKRVRAAEGRRRLPVVQGATYPGLRAYGFENAATFFGRDVEVAEAIGRLGPHTNGAHRRWLRIVGTPGCGASSFLRAGLVGGILRGGLHGAPPSWTLADVHGRGKPLTALAKAVGAAVGGLGSLETVESQLRQGGLPELLGGHLPEDTGMVMVIDPLEAVGDDADPADVARFDFLIADALDRFDLRFYLVTAEHVGADAGLKQLLPKLSDCTDFHAHAYRLGGLRSQAWRELIDGPSTLADQPWPPALAARILDDVEALTGGPGPANWALSTLCAARRQTVDSYDALGGVLHGAERAADRLVSALPEDNQRAIRTLLCALVRRRGGLDRPGRLDWKTAQDLLGGSEIDPLVKILARGRAEEGAPPLPLVRIEGADDERALTLAHGGLMELWSTLRRWLSADRSVRARVSTVTAACRDWADGGHSADGLPREARLAYLAGADMTPPERAAYRTRLNAPVRAFIEAGERAEASRNERAEAAANAERQAAYTQVVNEREKARRRVRFFAVTALALAILLAALAVISVRGQSQVFTLSDQLETLTRRHDRVLTQKGEVERQLIASKTAGKAAEAAKSASDGARLRAEASRDESSGYADELLEVNGDLLIKMADAFGRIPGNDGQYAHRQVIKWLDKELASRTESANADGRLRILAALSHEILAEGALKRGLRRGVRAHLEAAVKVLSPGAEGNSRRDVLALAEAKGDLARHLLWRGDGSSGTPADVATALNGLNEAIVLWNRVESLKPISDAERDLRLDALTARGRAHSLSGHHEKANADLNSVVGLVEAMSIKKDIGTALRVSRVFVERGQAAIRAKKYDAAREIFRGGLTAMEPAIVAFPDKPALFKLRRRLREGLQSVPQ